MTHEQLSATTHEQIINSLAIAIMAQDGAPPGRVSFARVLAKRIGAPYGSIKTWGRLGIPPGRAKAIADLALELRSVNLAARLGLPAITTDAILGSAPRAGGGAPSSAVSSSPKLAGGAPEASPASLECA